MKENPTQMMKNGLYAQIERRAIIDAKHMREESLAGFDGHVPDEVLSLLSKLDCNLEKTSQSQDMLVKAISKVQNPDINRILYLRYIEGHNLREVADIMNFSYAYVRKLHGDGVKSL